MIHLFDQLSSLESFKVHLQTEKVKLMISEVLSPLLTCGRKDRPSARKCLSSKQNTGSTPSTRSTKWLPVYFFFTN